MAKLPCNSRCPAAAFPCSSSNCRRNNCSMKSAGTPMGIGANRLRHFILYLCSAVFIHGSMMIAGAAEPPTEWIDSDTGHRIIRLSTEPGSASLYFHQNSFSPKGDRFVFDSPRGIEAVDLKALNHG